MTERYPPPGNEDGPNDDCPYSWISEWLCEYVDGTMDPSMRAVFDEYLDANPKLAEHVERLCRTRSLLNDCECQGQAAERTKERVQRVPIEESILASQGEKREESSPPAVPKSDAPPSVPIRAGTVAAVASAMTLMLGVGVVAGSVFFSDRARPGTVATEQTAAKPVPHAPDRPAVAPSSARSGSPRAAGISTAPRWSSAFNGSALLMGQFQVEEALAPMGMMSRGPGDSLQGGSPGRPALLQAYVRP